MNGKTRSASTNETKGSKIEKDEMARSFHLLKRSKFMNSMASLANQALLDRDSPSGCEKGLLDLRYFGASGHDDKN